VEKAFAIFTMLAILSVLIIVHECGHFLVARYFGFQTPVFGFGLPFGPSWTVGKKWGTEFKIHACLLGGYVAIPELGDESNADAFGPPEKPFRKFPIWQRALVAVAGVTFNVIFAYFICLVMVLSMGDPAYVVMAGKPNPAKSPAGMAGFRPGDIVLSVDGKPVTTEGEMIAEIKSHKNVEISVAVKRPRTNEDLEKLQEFNPRKSSEADYKNLENAMEALTLKVTPSDKGTIGLELMRKAVSYKKIEGNPIEIAAYAGAKLNELTTQMVTQLGQMIEGLVRKAFGVKGSSGSPDVGFQDLHGVLAVVVFGADVAQQDWTQLFIFTIMISMDLAIINLLPWPALDGGHLAFMCYEAIRGKPVEERTQGEIVKWGFLSLIVLMVVIMFNDVTALMTGKLSFKAMKEKAKEVRQQRESLNSPGSVDADPSGSKTPAAQDANKTDAPPADAPASEVKPAEPAPAH
jgi:membrane-associated protease RseP (regulator of RpoE activity)